VVENAFGRLKGRWRCLLKRIDHHTENVPYIVATCVTPHNLCELFGDRFQGSWEVRGDGDTESTRSRVAAVEDRSNTAAVNIRNALADYLFTH